MISLTFLILIAIISIIASDRTLPINKQDLLNIKGDMSVENLLGTDAGGEIILVDCCMLEEFL